MNYKSAGPDSSNDAGAANREKERILFVDDDELLVEVGCMIFEHLGYPAECYTDPERALEVFRAGWDRFSMVITDMSMPKMSGLELAVEVYKISPEMPVILCTGYDNPLTGFEQGKTGIKAVMTKPLGLNDFAEIIKNVFEQRE